jgi:molybdate transport system substrate-binding protein
MKKVVIILLSAALFAAWASSVSADSPKEITVSAAISLKNVFEEIGRLYESKNKGTNVAFNFGASGDLMRQIEAGAPVDVFASASQKEMDELEKEGMTAAGSKRIFAGNIPVLVVPRNSGMGISNFADLAASRVKRIAAGNPMTVPAGRYAEEVFRYYNLSGRIREKLILAGNVRQVLDYVARGEVDAGVVYMTDALSRSAEVKVVAEAPNASHQPALYPIAAIKGSGSESAAMAFISLVASAEGKKVLAKYGFRTVR